MTTIASNLQTHLESEALPTNLVWDHLTQVQQVEVFHRLTQLCWQMIQNDIAATAKFDHDHRRANEVVNESH